MKLARTIRFDASDEHVFAHAADEGEWAISGSFSFAHITDQQLNGKTKQAPIPKIGHGATTTVDIGPVCFGISEHRFCCMND